MADRDHKIWDGRFGERFDDEVSTKSVTYTIVGTGLLTVIAMILMFGLFHLISAESENGAAPTEAQMAPPLPRLQADPEGELEVFRARLEERIGSYGWVDEAAGIAHIPIEEAITLLVARGLPSTGSDTELAPAGIGAGAAAAVAGEGGHEEAVP